MKLNKSDIIKAYELTKHLATKAYLKNNYNKSLEHISTAARIASSFNWIYTDDELENLLQALSSSIIPTTNYPISPNGRYVFYDFQAFDNCCLTQQYLRALISYNVEILYIPERLIKSRSKAIINELLTYPKARILEIDDKMTSVERIRAIYNEINAFRPEKIFMQIEPSSAVAVTIFNAFPNVPKYFIDLADHLFYLGRSCANYFIEYRNRGCSVSINKRNLLPEQILLLPYYPVIDKYDFLGFPSCVTSDKVVIFSGGNYYKIGGKDATYFKILKRLLSENPSLIILYAGIGIDTQFEEFIRINNLGTRIKLLGFRKDINEVIKHCDIYLNTYPFSGGLMCQYAASNCKPILAYNTQNRESDFVETIICDNSSIKITQTNLEDFHQEANKLINNKKYRYLVGKSIHDCIIKPEEFNNSLHNLISNNTNSKAFKMIDICYDEFFDRYLYLQNNGSYSFKFQIIRNFKIKSIILFPKIVFSSLPLLLHPNLIIKKLREIF